MRKSLVVTALLFSSAPVLASETRMLTLRNTPGLIDETDVFTYPAMITNYSIALIELGTAQDTEVYGGALKAFGDLSVGAVLSRDQTVMTDVGGSSYSLVDDWLARAASNNDAKAILPAPERPIDLFYGMMLGSGSSFGVHLATANYRDNEKKTDGPTDKKMTKADQLDVGLGFSMQSGESRTDLGFEAGVMGTLKESHETATVTTSNSYKRGPELTLAARNTGKVGQGRRYLSAKGVSRAPEVKADNGTKAESGKFSEKGANAEAGYVVLPSKGTSISMGLGLSYFVSKGPIIAANSGVGSSGTTTAAPSVLTNDSKVKKTTNLLYTSLAVEAPVSEMFGLLGGLEYNLYGSIKTKDDFNTGKPQTETSVDQTPDVSLWALGFFFQQQALRVDASYSKHFLHSTPFLVAGDPTKSVLGRISVTYKM